MKTIRETEHTKVTEFGNGYKITDPIYSETYGSVSFQSGPIKENGANGCQIEDLLAICIHRLEGFQSGEFACEENYCALGNLELAIHHLKSRTKDRKNRGVEGTNQK